MIFMECGGVFIPLQEAVVISYIGGPSLAGLACTASPPFTTFFRWLYRVDIVRGVLHAVCTQEFAASTKCGSPGLSSVGTMTLRNNFKDGGRVR